MQAAIAHAHQQGDIRPELDPERAVDLLAGPLLARVFAGRDVGPAWREKAFELRWSLGRA